MTKGVNFRPALTHAACMGAEEQAIFPAEERASALAAGDSERLSGLLHDDFRWTTHVRETVGRSEYVRRNTGGHAVWR